MLKLTIIVVWTIMASGVTAALVWWDKRAARLNRRRIPERRLLLASLVGGWPGHLAMSRRIRHKTAKQAYRLAFIVVAVINLVFIWFLLL